MSNPCEDGSWPTTEQAANSETDPARRSRLSDFPALADLSILEETAIPESILEMDAFKDRLEDAMAACEAAIKALMAEEDFTLGIYRAGEIHEAKQLHAMLRYQRDLCTARINREKDRS